MMIGRWIRNRFGWASLRFHTIFLILVIGTSLLFGLEENGVIHLGRGLVQRALYLVSFIWLLASQYWSFVKL